MFFMFGIFDGSRELTGWLPFLCARCGRQGSYQAFMTYTALWLLFMPCARWNRRYYVRTSCCGTVYELDPEAGRRVAKGETVDVWSCRMRPVGDSRAGISFGLGPFSDGARDARDEKVRCPACGRRVEGAFEFCPWCGHRL